MTNKGKTERLRERSGCSLAETQKALALTNNDLDLAYTYLRLKHGGVVRKTIVEGEKVVWKEQDYLSKANELTK